MTAIIEGDHSKYPVSIRKVFPHLAGEVQELRDSWGAYSRLFMEKKKLTAAMEERLAWVWWKFQFLLENELFLSIARLTSKDSGAQKNLSLWNLLASIPDARDASFGDKVEHSLGQICAAAASIREHRHKRVAHFDLRVSLGTTVLPDVIANEIREVLEQIEEFLNLFYWEFEKTTMFFDAHSPFEITGQAEVTIYKAQTYDILEGKGVIPKDEWRKEAEK